MEKRLLLIPVLASLLLVAACAQAAPKLELPEGAEQMTPVIPGHGAHWANMAEFQVQAQAQKLMGPIYMVDGKGEVIGIEYMYTEDMLEEVTFGPEVFHALAPLPVGATVDHVDIAFVPQGHGEEFPLPHWDIHLFLITQEEKAAITPGG